MLRRNDHAGGRLDPFVVVGEAGIGAHGADDAIAGDFGAFGVFEDAVEHRAKIALASGVESGRMGMAVKRTGGDFKQAGRSVGLVPVEEKLLDLVAVRMMADDTLPLVAFERELPFLRAPRFELAATRATPNGPRLGVMRGGGFESAGREREKSAIERGKLRGEIGGGLNGRCSVRLRVGRANEDDFRGLAAALDFVA